MKTKRCKQCKDIIYPQSVRFVVGGVGLFCSENCIDDYDLKVSKVTLSDQE